MIREIKKDLVSKLKAINENVYFHEANEIEVFPHLVYSFSSLPESEGLIKGNLDIDVWNRSNDFSLIDDITENVAILLNKYHYLGEKCGYNLYLLSINNIETDDKTLKRKTIIFEIQIRRK